MYLLSIYVGGDLDGAIALQDCVARLLHRRARPAPERNGFVVTLSTLPEPADDDAFVALVSDGAERILVGPPELLDGH